MIDNFELICKNYTPTEKINWVNVDDEVNKSKTLFVAKLYNRNIKKGRFYLNLFMLADERKDYFTLMVRGNLNNWFTQKALGRKLSFEEFKYCLYLLRSEIDLDKHRILNSKVNNVDIKINIDLQSIYKRSKSTNP